MPYGSCRKKKGSAYTVKLATLFNGSRADYCPAYMGVEAQQLYFTSCRQQAKGDVSGITGIKMVTFILAKKTKKANGRR